MRLYVNTKTGKYGVTLTEIRRIYPNVSIPKDADVIFEFRSYDRTRRPSQLWNTLVHECAPTNGKQTWVEDVVSDDVLHQRYVNTVQANQARRESELRMTDWTQLSDVPEHTRSRWSEYRRALRDLDLNNLIVAWPEKPEVNNG